MYVVLLIYCSFLSYCLQLVSYPYFITDCLFIFSEVEFFFLSLFRLVLVDIDIGDKDYENYMVSKILI